LQPYGQHAAVYPAGAEQAYPAAAAGQARSGAFPWPVAAIGAFALLCLVISAVLLRGVMADRLVEPTSTERPTYTDYPTYTSPPPTQPPTETATPRPTDTDRPTSTPRPTDTTRPTEPPTATSVPTRTRTPVPTQPTSLTVRIRNRTNYNVNLYRIGMSGGADFLGWLVPGYYGIYPFPSLDTWTIEYCRRDTDGSSYNCNRKTINVTANDQEFSVP
jgi:hypothetical protein